MYLSGKTGAAFSRVSGGIAEFRIHYDSMATVTSLHYNYCCYYCTVKFNDKYSESILGVWVANYQKFRASK